MGAGDQSERRVLAETPLAEARWVGPRWTAEERPGPCRSPDGPSACAHGEQTLRARGVGRRAEGLLGGESRVGTVRGPSGQFGHLWGSWDTGCRYFQSLHWGGGGKCMSPKGALGTRQPVYRWEKWGMPMCDRGGARGGPGGREGAGFGWALGEQ